MVVGLEVHVQLKTATKIFCRCSTNFGAAPNANTCPVCLALPGALPVLNDHAVELAIARGAGARLHRCSTTSIFARKNYFYPDLPKGYQISQFDKPLATNGRLQIGDRTRRRRRSPSASRACTWRRTRANRFTIDFAGATAVDLNRAGVPLVEIVSEPDMRSRRSADAYLRGLKQILEYVGRERRQHGGGQSSRRREHQRRARTARRELGTKTEVKNMNSFSASCARWKWSSRGSAP